MVSEMVEDEADEQEVETEESGPWDQGRGTAGPRVDRRRKNGLSGSRGSRPQALA